MWCVHLEGIPFNIVINFLGLGTSSVWGAQDGMSTLSSLLLEEKMDIVWGVPFERILVHVFKSFWNLVHHRLE